MSVDDSQGSITLHSDTSFQTTISLHSHSLGDDTDKEQHVVGSKFKLYVYILVTIRIRTIDHAMCFLIIA